MNRMLGHILLWVGFLAAAFWSCYQLEVEGDKWSTVPWQWYGLAMAIGLGGVFILRSTSKNQINDAAKNDADYTTIQNSLQALIKGMAKLQSLAEEEKVSQISKTIDDEMAEPFSEFADARQALINRHGLQFFADVMTQFASAERFVNRTWSASVDGYIDEVNKSLDRASKHLANASELVAAADKQSGS